jgi:CHAT domain-containing protein/tetratricopeptide (TPR) repeat protein
MTISPTPKNSTRNVFLHCLRTVVTLGLCCATLAAQTAQTKQETVKRLILEGKQLVDEGSRTSLLQAIRKFEEVRSIYHSLNDPAREAAVLITLGTLHQKVSQLREAIESFSAALPLYHAANDLQTEAKLGISIGLAYSTLGENQRALETLNKALLLFRSIRDREGEATTLAAAGNQYASLQKYDEALDHFNQALSLFRALGHREGEAVVLVAIGPLHVLAGEHQKALDDYERVLTLARAAGDKYNEALALSVRGFIYNDQGNRQQALEDFTRALPLMRALGDRAGEAIVLEGLGAVYFESGEYQKGLGYLVQARELCHTLGNLLGEATALTFIATAEDRLGNLPEAREKIEAAVTIIESIRTKVTNQDLRFSFFGGAIRHYEHYINILMKLHRQRPEAGYDGEALQACERGRARDLLDMLNEAKADIRQGVDPALLLRERSVQKSLNEKAQQRMQMLSQPHSQNESDAIAQAIADLTKELHQVEAEIRQTSPAYAALTQPQPLTAKQIQEQLDSNSLMLEYSLGVGQSYLWAVTQNSITSYKLPKREEIEGAARQVYGLLNARNERVKGETRAQRTERVAQADKSISAAAARLSQLVLAPAAAQLGKKRLVIVGDGMLLYIPFAVLPTPTANGVAVASPPLIVEHEVVSLPSASTLAVLRREVAGRKPAPKTVVVIADPVFTKNDERVKRALNKSNDGGQPPPSTTLPSRTKTTTAPAGTDTARDLELVEPNEDAAVSSSGLYVPRLLGSRKEAEEITAMVPASESKLVLDFEANRRAATSAELGLYRYVHFSTHGFLDSVHPELSGIVFSLINQRGEGQDGILRAHEIFNLKLPAEVVVLSACQTGIGKEVKGEGLVSLTRGFMYAGAPRVVVSLWSVNETGTAVLMVRFYKEMLKGGKTPAAALRAAQIVLMKEEKWRSPFYWAAFTLQGEWR